MSEEQATYNATDTNAVEISCRACRFWLPDQGKIWGKCTLMSTDNKVVVYARLAIAEDLTGRDAIVKTTLSFGCNQHEARS